MLSAKEFEGLSGDLSDQIRTLVPSYNVNTQPISDASTIVRPASLRNLAPDHTLVLINGERRHRAAVIYWLGNGWPTEPRARTSRLIPSIALRQVEVLRDGASAQYGSDAIAGVMNFMLRDSRKGGTFQLQRRHHPGRRRRDVHDRRQQGLRAGSARLRQRHRRSTAAATPPTAACSATTRRP